jgi:hypothetical protein
MLADLFPGLNHYVFCHISWMFFHISPFSPGNSLNSFSSGIATSFQVSLPLMIFQTVTYILDIYIIVLPVCPLSLLALNPPCSPARHARTRASAVSFVCELQTILLRSISLSHVSRRRMAKGFSWVKI